MAEAPLVLGIETSCDETGVGLVRGTTLLADGTARSLANALSVGGDFAFGGSGGLLFVDDVKAPSGGTANCDEGNKNCSSPLHPSSRHK